MINWLLKKIKPTQVEIKEPVVFKKIQVKKAKVGLKVIIPEQQRFSLSFEGTSFSVREYDFPKESLKVVQPPQPWKSFKTHKSILLKLEDSQGRRYNFKSSPETSLLITE